MTNTFAIRVYDADEGDDDVETICEVEFLAWKINTAKAGAGIPFPDGSGRILRVVSTTPLPYCCGFECCGIEYTHEVRVESPSND
jgi:hypothetical protein